MQAGWTLDRGSKTVSGFPLWFLPWNLLEFLPCIPSVMGWRNQAFLLQVSFGQNEENPMMTMAKFATPKPSKICNEGIFTIYSFLGVSSLELFSCGKMETIHPLAHSFSVLPISSCKLALYSSLIIQLFQIPYKQYPMAFVT